jgi:hypothetical protein
LEEAGFIRRTKTKRANGYRGKDVLDITSPTGPVEAQKDWASNVRTSHDYSYNSHIANKPLVPNSQDSNKLKDSESKGILMKEIKIPMRKWEDDGEDLAGVLPPADRHEISPGPLWERAGVHRLGH